MKSLKMDFREASPRKAKATTTRKSKGGGTSNAAQARLVPLAQRKAAKSSTTLSHKRSRQDVLEEAQDFVDSSDDDYIEDDSDNGRVESVRSAPSKRLRSSAAKTAPQLCLEKLIRLRGKVGLVRMFPPRVQAALTAADWIRAVR